MGILTDTLFLAIFALPIMGLRGYVISEPPQNGGFVSFCAFTGANLTDGHWLGVYCENNDISDFGYNYTWYISLKITLLLTFKSTYIRFWQA